jgi:hypothetical protein
MAIVFINEQGVFLRFLDWAAGPRYDGGRCRPNGSSQPISYGTGEKCLVTECCLWVRDKTNRSFPRKNPLQTVPSCSILVPSNDYVKDHPFLIQKIFPMNQNLEAPATGKILFKLTILGCVLLGCVYGFLMLFNTALAAIK